MLFGIGGIYVEVIGDVVLRMAPFNRIEARTMIEEIKGIKLLQGVRGQKPSDLEAVVDVLLEPFPPADRFSRDRRDRYQSHHGL